MDRRAWRASALEAILHFLATTAGVDGKSEGDDVS